MLASYWDFHLSAYYVLCSIPLNLHFSNISIYPQYHNSLLPDELLVRLHKYEKDISRIGLQPWQHGSDGEDTPLCKSSLDI